MIDVRVSNLKLYRRACLMVAELTGVSLDVATECVIRTIHDVDVPKPLPKMLWDLSVTEHLERAKVVNRLVPTAILIATGASLMQPV
jgi:N-acetylmuramic acid 6-phosphate (MurNAc-6-P) etherase